MAYFTILSNPKKIYTSMLKDISNAKKEICLETYIYDDDEIGASFKETLIERAASGVKVMLLIDAWGSSVKKEYFHELISLGAEVRFFREIRYVIRILSRNHERNHRKLLIIDQNLAYMGSANITASCLSWRELVLRIQGELSLKLISSFMLSWNSFNQNTFVKARTIFHKGFQIVQDVPSDEHQLTRSKYISLIKSAKNNISIETPYFVPSSRIRRALYEAIERGVKVRLVLPYISDVRLIDLVRNRYLSKLFRRGIEIYYYKKSRLHSKLLIIDDNFFLLGSSNIDYRSFIHQHEINLIGTSPAIIASLQNYFQKTLSGCVPFNYEEWKNRSSIGKIAENIFSLIRKYL